MHGARHTHTHKIFAKQRRRRNVNLIYTHRDDLFSQSENTDPTTAQQTRQGIMKR